MRESHGIEIVKAVNGYIVRTPYDPRTDSHGHPHVFETFEALVAHLRTILVAQEASK